MKVFLRICIFLFFSAFFITNQAYGQCITSNTLTTQDVTCPGGSDGTATISVTGGAGTYRFELYVLDGFNLVEVETVTVSAQEYEFTGLFAGTYRVVIVQQAGCPVVTSLPGVVGTANSSPVTSPITGDNQVCENETGVPYSVVSTAGSTYNWTVPAGANIVSGQGTASIVVNFGSSAGDVTVTETSSAGCPGAPVSLAVDLVPTPDPTFTADSPVCVGENATVTVTNIDPAAAYTWNFDGGSIISGSGSGPYEISWPTEGNKTIELTVLKDGCSATSQVIVEVRPIPTSTFDLDAQGCTDVSTTITYTGTATPGATYTWNFDGGNVISGSGQGPYEVEWNTIGVKTVTLTVAEGGCTSILTSNDIEIFLTPTATFDLPADACEEEQVTITYTGTASPAATYTWNFEGAVVDSGSGQGPYLVRWTTPGSKNVTLQVTENGCPSEIETETILINPLVGVPTVQVATDIVCDAFTANWTAASDANGYFLDVSTDNTFAIIDIIDNQDVGNVTAFPVSGLSTGTTYFYRLRAYNDCGVSANSGTQNVTTVDIPDAPVSNAASAIDCNEFTANWQLVPGTTSYVLDVATTNTFTPGTFVTEAQNVGNVTSFIVSGLDLNTQYFYRVRAVNDCGESTNSATQNATTLDVPANVALGATSNIECTSFQINWAAAANATSYEVEVHEDAGFTSLVFSTTTAGLNATATGLDPGVTYFYRVRAINDCGPSAFATGSETTDPVPPQVVSQAVSNEDCQSFQANWTALAGVLSYDVEVSTDAAFTDIVTTVNIPGAASNSTVISGLTEGTIYFYRVSANNVCGAGPFSGEQQAETLPLPVQVQDVVASNEDCTSFDLTWTAVPGATSYIVEVSADNTFGVVDFTATPAGNNVSATGLNADTEYFFRVRAVNACGNGDFSDVGSTNTLSTPEQVNALAASNIDCQSFSANWEATAGATSYILDVSTTNTFNPGTFVPGFEGQNVGNVLTSNISGLAEGTEYFYRVRAVNDCGEGLNSNVVAVTTVDFPDQVVLDPVSDVDCDAFTINWQAAAGANSYRVDVATDAGFTSLVAGFSNVSTTDLFLSVTGLNLNTQYFFRVRAEGDCGLGLFSATGNTSTLDIPGAAVVSAPTDIQCDEFTANWEASTNANGYFLDVSTSPVFASNDVIDNQNVGNVTSFAVTGLDLGTTYYYRVRASNDCGVTANSGTSSATTQDVLAAPVVQAASAIDCDEFTANWAVVPGAIAYVLDVATTNTFNAGTFVVEAQNVGNVTSFEVTGLSINTQYFYRVRSVNNCGESANSATENVTTLNIPNNVTLNATSDVECNSFQINYNATAGATAYEIEVHSNPGFTNLVFSSTTVGLSEIATGLDPGVTYFYRVRAINDCGPSAFVSGFETTDALPAQVVSLAASDEDCQSFQANWTALAGVLSYDVEVATDAAFADIVATVNVPGAASNATVISGLTEGTTYFYRVRANNVCGAGSFSVTQQVETLPLPTQVLNVVANNIDCTEFELSWTAVAGAVSYIVEVSTDNTFAVIDFTASPATNAQLVSGLAVGTEYFYRVRAVNTCGEGDNSVVAAATTADVLEAPANLLAGNIDCDQFRISWDAVVGAIAYRVDVSTDPAFGSFVAGFENIAVTDLFLDVTGLNNATTYHFRVRAENSCGLSANTIGNTTTLDVADTPVLAPVSDLDCESFTINWQAAAGATSYRVDVSTQADFSSFVTGFENFNAGTDLSVTVIGLNSGTAYFFRVRAVNNCGNSANADGTQTTLDPPSAASIAVDVCEDSFGAALASNINLNDYNSLINNAGGLAFTWFTTAALDVAVADPSDVSVTNGAEFFVLVDDGTCTNSASLTFNVLDLPEANDFVDELCEDLPGSGTATFDLSTFEFNINADGVSTITWFTTAALDVPVGDPANVVINSDTVFFAVVNNGNCDNVATLSLSIADSPVANDITISACADVEGGNEATITLSAFEDQINNDGLSTIEWFANADFTGAIDPTIAASFTDTQELYVRVSNASCETTAVVTISISDLPDANDVVLEFCEDSFGAGTATAVDLTSAQVGINPDPTATFVWATDAAFTDIVADPSEVDVTNNEVFFVRVTLGGCENTAEVTIQINELPEVSNAVVEVCEESFGSETATIDLADFQDQLSITPGVTFEFFTDAGLTTQINNPDAFLLSSDTLIYVRVSAPNSCENLAELSINLRSLPMANSLTELVCEDDFAGGEATIDLGTFEASINNSGLVTFTWFSDAALTTAVNNPENVVINGDITFFVLVDDGTCTNSASLSLEIADKPNAADLNPELCEDDQGTGEATVNINIYNVTISGNTATSFTWFSDAALTQPLGADTIVTVASGDSYFVLVANEDGCTNTGSVTFTIFPTVQVFNLSAGGEICSTDDGIELTLDGSELDVTYELIRNTNVVATLAGTGDPLSFGLIDEEGDYTVRAINADNCARQMAGTAQISIRESATVSFTGLGDVCFGEQIDIVFSFENGTAPYTVEFNNGYQLILLEDLVDGSVYSYVAEASGQFEFVITSLTDADGCTVTAPSANIPEAFEFNVAPNPTFDLGGDQAICDGGSISLNPGFAQPDNFTYSWTKDGDPTVISTDSILVVSEAGLYSLEVTTLFGDCTFSDEVTISLGTAVAVDLGADISTCDADVTLNTGLAADDFTFVWVLNGNTIAGATNPSLVATESGTYTVLVTDLLSGQCSASDTIEVVVGGNVVPGGNIIFDQSPICPDAEKTFTLNLSNMGANPSIAWFIGTDEQFGETGLSFTAAFPASATVRAVVNVDPAISACADPTSITIEVEVEVVNEIVPTASISLAPAQDAYCLGQEITFFGGATGVGVTPTYEWYVNGVQLVGESNTNVILSSLQDGDVVRFLVRVSAEQTCATIDSVFADTVISIVDEITPAVTLSGPTEAICSGGNLVFTANITNAGSNPVITWTVNGVVTANPSNILTLANPASGTYNVQVSVEPDPSLGCATGDATASATGIVRAIDDPECVVDCSNFDISVIPTNVTCDGDEDGSAFIVFLTQGSGQYEYSFDGENFTEFNTNNILFEIANLGQGRRTLTVRDRNFPDCIDNATFTIGTQVQIFASVTTSRPDCGAENGSATITASGGLAPYTYTLSGDALSEDIENSNGVFSNLVAGLYNYRIEDANGCIVENIPFNLEGASTLSATVSEVVDSQCAGRPQGRVTINVTGGANPFQYTIDGFSWNTFVSGNAITGLPAGSYNILVRADENDACPLVVPVTIGEFPATVLDGPIMTEVPASCNNNDGVVSIPEVSGGTPPYRFQIDGRDFVLPENRQITALSRGFHTFTVIDANNCLTAFDFNVDSPDLVLFDITTNPATCEGEAADGQMTINITQGRPPYFYSVNGSFFREVPGTNFTLTGLARGAYEVVIKSEDPDEGCPNVRTINIGGPVIISYEIAKENVQCHGDASGIIRISNIRGAGVDASLTVRLNGQVYRENVGSALDIINLPAGRYEVEIEQIGGCSFIKTEILEITQPTLLQANIGEVVLSKPDLPTGSIEFREIRGGVAPYFVELIGLEDSNRDVEIPFVRVFGDTTFFPNLPPRVTYDTTFTNLWPGNYRITVMDFNGCDTTFTVNVPVDTDIFIPNVFTPNNDGVNDFFFIRNLPDAGNQLIITNRWGKVVYQDNDHTNSKQWDGDGLPDGVYYYKLTVPNTGSFTGWVEIWRGNPR